MDPSKAGDSSGTPVPVISQPPVDIVDSNLSPPTLIRPEQRACIVIGFFVCALGHFGFIWIFVTCCSH